MFSEDQFKNWFKNFWNFKANNFHIPLANFCKSICNIICYKIIYCYNAYLFY